jgi:hypothetical protein
MGDRKADNFSNANALIVAAAVMAIVWSTGMAQSMLMSLEHSVQRATMVSRATQPNVHETVQTASANEPSQLAGPTVHSAQNHKFIAAHH